MAMGAQAMSRDMGADLKPRIQYDATARAAIANRRGDGRFRHLHTPSLWIQRHAQEGRVALPKVDGTERG